MIRDKILEENFERKVLGVVSRADPELILGCCKILQKKLKMDMI